MSEARWGRPPGASANGAPNESSPKRVQRGRSRMRGVIVGAGLGVLAAKKSRSPSLKSAMASLNPRGEAMESGGLWFRRRARSRRSRRRSRAARARSAAPRSSAAGSGMRAFRAGPRRRRRRGRGESGRSCSSPPERQPSRLGAVSTTASIAARVPSFARRNAVSTTLSTVARLQRLGHAGRHHPSGLAPVARLVGAGRSSASRVRATRVSGVGDPDRAMYIAAPQLTMLPTPASRGSVLP